MKISCGEFYMFYSHPSGPQNGSQFIYKLCRNAVRVEIRLPHGSGISLITLNGHVGLH